MSRRKLRPAVCRRECRRLLAHATRQLPYNLTPKNIQHRRKTDREPAGSHPWRVGQPAAARHLAMPRVANPGGRN